MTKQSVFVGILTNSLFVHASHVLFAYHLPYWASNPEFPYDFALWVEGENSPQAYKRNEIIRRFLETDCETLLMIDDDMILDGTTLDLLATPDYDICGPLQFTMKGKQPDKGIDTPECYPCAFTVSKSPDGKMRPVWPAPGVKYMPIDIVGSGVMAIKRHVLEDPRMIIEPDGPDPQAFFQDIYASNGRRTRGLDVDFCLRARELDYRVVINWTVEVGHYKRVSLNDMDLYAKAQFMMGVEMGRKGKGNGEISLASGQSGPPQEQDRRDRRDEASDESVAGVGMDRAARRRAARREKRRRTASR